MILKHFQPIWDTVIHMKPEVLSPDPALMQRLQTAAELESFSVQGEYDELILAACDPDLFEAERRYAASLIGVAAQVALDGLRENGQYAAMIEMGNNKGVPYSVRLEAKAAAREAFRMHLRSCVERGETYHIGDLALREDLPAGFRKDARRALPKAMMRSVDLCAERGEFYALLHMSNSGSHPGAVRKHAADRAPDALSKNLLDSIARGDMNSVFSFARNERIPGWARTMAFDSMRDMVERALDPDMREKYREFMRAANSRGESATPRRLKA